MRAPILILSLVMLPFSAVAADDAFYGTYTLTSSTRTILDTGQVETFARERGFITYSKDGRMMVLIVRGDRPKPESLEKTTDQQRAEMFRSMTAYGGTYKFDGRAIEHHIDIAWNEVLTGTIHIRDVKRDGDKLIYTTRPAPQSGTARPASRR